MDALGLTYYPKKLMLFGLDNAGKTTLLHVLRDDTLLLKHVPTRKLTIEDLVVNNVPLRVFDFNGEMSTRALWPNYQTIADVAVFMIDATDPDRFEEVKAELNSLFFDCDYDSRIPICILCNKTDKPDAVSEDQIRAALGLTDPKTMENMPRNWHIQMCSIKERKGYREGLDWLLNFYNT